MEKQMNGNDSLMKGCNGQMDGNNLQMNGYNGKMKR
jgi:hypothetical protein